ncbi:MAG: histone deacetylase [Acidobacteriota bacterium]
MSNPSLLSRADRGLRRGFRRLLRHVVQPPLQVVYSSTYSRGHASVPADPRRGERVLTFLEMEGLMCKACLRKPRPAAFETLRRVHTDDYLESLRHGESATKVVGTPLDDPELEALLDIQRAMVGGTNLATAIAAETRGVVANLGGGLHHAWADRGQGFCVFNDIACAIEARRSRGFGGRVLVVDLDLHHGDGTEGIFAEDPSVHTFSIHNRPWSNTAARESTNLALGSNVDDGTFLEVLRRELPPVFERFQPELVIYLTGADPAGDDTLGDWQLSDDALLVRDRFVFDLARGERKLPLVILLAGGYGPEAWRYNARFLGWIANQQKALEPPTTHQITISRFRHLARLVDPAELSGDSSEEDWSLSEEDLFGALGPSSRRTRFLGYYTRHGLEFAFERYGLLDQLRSRGFAHPTLDWNLDDESGETLRLFGDAERQELLMELRARKNRRTLPKYELLQVEWLLLQNPRQEFGGRRPKLPGQEHPGLGMLRDVVAMMIIACERLHLDGLAFVPAHYHLAATAHVVLPFLKPEDQVFFRHLRSCLKDLSLGEGTRRLAAGDVHRADTGETVQWHPMSMVLPVSEKLTAFFEDEAYQQRLTDAESRQPELVLSPKSGQKTA